MKTPETGKGTNVLRKTPEEIKKGLECQRTNDGDCESCAYYEYHCCEFKLAADALAYIQQLEAELDDEKNKNEILIFDNDKLMEEIAQAERERDVAVEDLREASFCGDCFHYAVAAEKEPCASCLQRGTEKPNWQWRGVCPENTKEVAR